MVESAKESLFGKPEHIGDEALLDLVQRQTFAYFWDFAHPQSGMARDRTGTDGGGSSDLLAVGGTGFGVMAIIVAVERGWISRAEAIDRLLDMLSYLDAADQYNGVFPHYLDGPTGKEVSFWADNAGGDLVETSYLVQGLLCARQYFCTGDPKEKAICAGIDNLWRKVNWNWHTKGADVLFWHRNARTENENNHRVEGWNECLITYIWLPRRRHTPSAQASTMRAGQRAPSSRTARNITGSPCPSAQSSAARFSSRITPFLALIPEVSKTATLITGSRTAITRSSITSTACATLSLISATARTAGA